MVVNLHFQFANQEPGTVQWEIPGARAGEHVWLDAEGKRIIRKEYKKTFHRALKDNVFTFHQGQGINTEPIGFRFNYSNRYQYRIVIPHGRKKHLWTNGRRYVNRQERRRLGRRWPVGNW